MVGPAGGSTRRPDTPVAVASRWADHGVARGAAPRQQSGVRTSREYADSRRSPYAPLTRRCSFWKVTTPCA